MAGTIGRTWQGVLLAALLPSCAFAGEAFDACAAAAASQYEWGYEAIGRDRWEIDPSAIETCLSALEEDPESPALKAWLGRAHDALGDSASGG